MTLATTRLTIAAAPLTNHDPDDLGAGPKRAYRALTEPMLVVPDTDDDQRTTGRYTVYSFDSAGVYAVDLDSPPACDCPDMSHYEPAAGCKHIRRAKAAVAVGHVPAPGGVLADAQADRLRVLQEDFQSHRRFLADVEAGLAAARQ